MSVAEEVRVRMEAMKRRVEAVRRKRAGGSSGGAECNSAVRRRAHWWEKDNF